MTTIKAWSMATILVLLALTFSASAQFQRRSIEGGRQFIELGNWRVGNFDDNHFVFTHKNGNTAVIYRSDGTVHPGPRTDFSLFKKPKKIRAKDVQFGDKYVQFGGVWRLAQINPQHLSLSHVSGNTAMIWRADGTKHPGPRKDFSGFDIKSDETNKIKYGKGILEIGVWRIGQVDENHLSIGTPMTSDIYRSDGTIHPGPRFDWNLADVDL